MFMPRDRIYAVHLSLNLRPEAKDQFTDVGETYEECVRRAEGYADTSYYQRIVVVDLQCVGLKEMPGTAHRLGRDGRPLRHAPEKETQA